jgi:cytochrome c oxidase subunit 2
MFSNPIGLSSRIVENVFLYIAAIAVFLLVLITFFMVYFVIRYHRKRHPQPKDIKGSTWLEILWTIVPTLLVLTMFYYGLKGFQSMKKIPEDAMKVKVLARQWSWLFEYENGLKASELRVPVGKATHLALASQDVIHSLYIPAFKVKQDAVPGMVNHLWFKPMEVGTYDVLCAEYCGLQHSYMLTKVIVLPEEEFKKWYKEGGEREAKLPPSGLKLFEEKGCKACHSTDGSQLVGPTVKGLFGKTVMVLTEGKERPVKADEVYLRKSLLEPNADIVKGFPPIMPSQKGLLTEREANEIIQYLKGLK